MAEQSVDPTRRSDGLPGTDESTPLLGVPDTAGTKALRGDSGNGTMKSLNGHVNGHAGPQDSTGGDESTEPTSEEDKPLPYVQVLLLCFASLVEPIAYFAIFPFISEMLVRTGGLDIKAIGFWSGLMEALFSIVQMMLMIPYGRISDRMGRKPVLVFSLAGISCATALFGLAGNLWQMIVLRCLAGLFAGSSVTIRAMLSENCTKKTQARAFSWYMFARNMGIFLGPLLGGGLADPEKQFRWNNPLFRQFPFALPTFITGAFCLTTAIACLFFLKETLKRKSDASGEVEAPMSMLELLKSPGVARVILIYAHVMLLALSYTAVNPVFLYTPVHLGGFGFPTQWISVFIATAGASQAAWMLGPFPPLQKRLGTGAVLRGCSYVWPLFMLGYPLGNELLRHEAKVPFWIVLPITLIGGSGVAMAFACVQLCLNDVAPSPATLGTLNAIALTVNSAIRGVVPVASTSIFEAGVNSGWLDGHLIWVFIVGVALALVLAVRYLPSKAEGKID